MPPNRTYSSSVCSHLPDTLLGGLFRAVPCRAVVEIRLVPKPHLTKHTSQFLSDASAGPPLPIQRKPNQITRTVWGHAQAIGTLKLDVGRKWTGPEAPPSSPSPSAASLSFRLASIFYYRPVRLQLQAEKTLSSALLQHQLDTLRYYF
ncbi:unnamed protein product [Protopolystoma xenopodis]|uniref:Uncharacterized protein n=1 Tax=Protopolystoma xenopodis TaxID=117903 RepID=A0A3S5FGZ0_9PLAT|nr:unnamed protein product [Protopolystoma xenopodis]